MNKEEQIKELETKMINLMQECESGDVQNKTENLMKVLNLKKDKAKLEKEIENELSIFQQIKKNMEKDTVLLEYSAFKLFLMNMMVEKDILTRNEVGKIDEVLLQLAPLIKDIYAGMAILGPGNGDDMVTDDDREEVKVAVKEAEEKIKILLPSLHAEDKNENY